MVIWLVLNLQFSWLCSCNPPQYVQEPADTLISWERCRDTLKILNISQSDIGSEYAQPPPVVIDSDSDGEETQGRQGRRFTSTATSSTAGLSSDSKGKENANLSHQCQSHEPCDHSSSTAESSSSHNLSASSSVGLLRRGESCTSVSNSSISKRSMSLSGKLAVPNAHGQHAMHIATGKTMTEQLLRYHQHPDGLWAMSQAELVQLVRSASAVLGHRTEKVDQLHAANKQLKRQNSQLERDLTTLRDITNTKTNAMAFKRIKKLESQPSSLELKTRGKTCKRLTAESVLAVGLRRNFSNIAASDFGATVLFALSHQTVTRCEVRAASSLKAEFAAFVLEKLHMCHLLCQANHDNPEACGDSFTVFSLAIRSDATNSNIWRRQKLHLCEATVGFSCNIDVRTGAGLCSSPLERKRLLLLGNAIQQMCEVWRCGVESCGFDCKCCEHWFQKTQLRAIEQSLFSVIVFVFMSGSLIIVQLINLPISHHLTLYDLM